VSFPSLALCTTRAAATSSSSSDRCDTSEQRWWFTSAPSAFLRTPVQLASGGNRAGRSRAATAVGRCSRLQGFASSPNPINPLRTPLNHEFPSRKHPKGAPIPCTCLPPIFILPFFVYSVVTLNCTSIIGTKQCSTAKLVQIIFCFF
jgi:hypothetical protein